MRHLLLATVTLLLAACGEGEPILPADGVLPDGGRYRGTLVDGLMQGDGRIDYPDGSFYEGPFRNGRRHGEGLWQAANGDRYEGTFRDGLFDGQGRFSFASGGVYEGDFHRGHMQGKGRFRQGEASYQGEFRADLYHGQGVLEYADGSRYEGQFVAGHPHGLGTRQDAQGTFSGQFRDGVLAGPGSYVDASGARYSGEFADDQFHGQGRYEEAGDVWIGTFVNGELSGQGEHLAADGSRYSGEFRAWQYDGRGRLERPDGSVYLGEFSHGRFAGRGELSLADGTRQVGLWRKGLRVRDEQGRRLPDPLELALLEQGALLQRAIDQLPASTPAPELYALTLAGDGRQSVFMREADYVDQLLGERFAARGRISLVNHRDQLAERPLATRENLARALRAIAERSGPEDLVFIYLTSHGTADHRLVLAQPRLALSDLGADELAELMQPLGKRRSVVVISACYSGGFIEPLKSPQRLVMTAASADRVSFGCSEQNDFTYFGRALFEQALQQTDDLAEAFALAQSQVAEWEAADDYEPSQPQLWAPPQVLEQWLALRAGQARSMTDRHKEQ
ncbi:C13 family peptidase [Stutzerimonas balearica]|uniref:C13 family peptidase n=1 Tax=Stutzerimonas balearica TaxID=74829 RepID=UPI003F769B4B